MRRTDTQVSFVVEEDDATFGAHDTQRKAYFSALRVPASRLAGGRGPSWSTRCQQQQQPGRGAALAALARSRARTRCLLRLLHAVTAACCSSILPIPFSISKTGVLVGCLTMLLVAWANDATSCMLIRAAAATRRPTYEALAEWAGGKPWKVFTQVSLILLLWGTMCGGLALISDVGKMLVTRLAESDTGGGGGASGGEPWAPPPWLSGRGCMAGIAVLVLFPLCLQRHMRELETAATAGVVLVVCLIVLLGAEAVETRFPAIADGSLPLWSLHLDGHLPEAFSVVGYAFYMQPMMMPLLREMPEGKAGIRVMQRAVHTTLFGVALTVYFAMGLFGAAIFGQDTQGNIMVNTLVTGRAATAGLYGCMLLYLALGMTTTQYALRASLDLIIVGEGAQFTWTRQVVMTTLTVGSSLTVALLVPDKAEKIYAVVGATAVCVVCYVIPVFIQLTLYARHRQHLKQQQLLLADGESQLAAALLAHEAAPAGDADAAPPVLAPAAQPQACCSGIGGGGSGSSGLFGGQGTGQGRAAAFWELLHEAIVPVFILLLGVGFSVAALWVAVSPWLPGVVSGVARPAGLRSALPLALGR